MDSVVGIIIFRGGIQLMSSESKEKMRPEGAVVLNFLGERNRRLDFPRIAEVSKRKIFLLKNKSTLWKCAKTGYYDRWKNVDIEIQGTVGGPYRDNDIGDGAVIRNFAASRTISEGRDTTRLGSRSSILLLRAEELVDDELRQQEDTETVKGGSEAGLDRKKRNVNQLDTNVSSVTTSIVHVRFAPARLCAVFVVASCSMRESAEDGKKQKEGDKTANETRSKIASLSSRSGMAANLRCLHLNILPTYSSLSASSFTRAIPTIAPWAFLRNIHRRFPHDGHPSVPRLLPLPVPCP